MGEQTNKTTIENSSIFYSYIEASDRVFKPCYSKTLMKKKQIFIDSYDFKLYSSMYFAHASYRNVKLSPEMRNLANNINLVEVFTFIDDDFIKNYTGYRNFVDTNETFGEIINAAINTYETVTIIKNIFIDMNEYRSLTDEEKETLRNIGKNINFVDRIFIADALDILDKKYIKEEQSNIHDKALIGYAFSKTFI